MKKSETQKSETQKSGNNNPKEHYAEIGNNLKRYLLTIFPLTFSATALISTIFVFRTAANTTGDDIVASLEIIKSYTPLNIFIINIVPISTAFAVSALVFVLPAVAYREFRILSLYLKRFYIPLWWESKKIPWSNARFPLDLILLIIIAAIFYAVIDGSILYILGKFLQQDYDLKNDRNIIIAIIAFQVYVTMPFVSTAVPRILSYIILAVLLLSAAYMPISFVGNMAIIPDTCIVESTPNSNIAYRGIYLSDSGDKVTMLIKESIAIGSGEPHQEVWVKTQINVTDNSKLVISACE